MKSTLLLCLLAGVQAHTIYQKTSVNDVDQGQFFGVRTPNNADPLRDVNDPNLACNVGISQQDSNIITIPQGAKVGTFWAHGQIQNVSPGDPDNPVAVSHKGPMLAYLAKVDNAVSTGGTGLQWFKVAQEGLSGQTWGSDTMINNGGWWSFTMPSCVTAGQYLMRVELIALHDAAPGQPGAQFYTSCAQIQVTGSGASNPSTVGFPGVYRADDPGILVGIYDGTGAPYMGGQPYAIPGPAPLDCASASIAAPAPPPVVAATVDTSAVADNPASNMPPLAVFQSGGSPCAAKIGSGSGAATPTTMVTSVVAQPSVPAQPAQQAPPAQPASNQPSSWGASGGLAGLMEQCGGEGWTGPTACKAGTCTVGNQWFSLCLP